MEHDPDIELVEAARAGDHAAFETLVVRYQRQLVAIVYRMTGNAADAPDMVQKIFFKAYTKLRGFRGMSSFKTWLYSIAINIARNELRSRKRWGVPANVEDLNLGVKQRAEDDLIDRQRREGLAGALEELPPKQKAVLTLRIQQELSFAEIGHSLGMTENTAKVNFHHAMKRLQSLLRIKETFRETSHEQNRT